MPVVNFFNDFIKGFGSGSGLDPDSVTLWIRIRIGNTDPGSGSRGKKIKKFQWKNALLVILKKLLLKSYKIALALAVLGSGAGSASGSGLS
jgi:hypothetical protein